MTISDPSSHSPRQAVASSPAADTVRAKAGDGAKDATGVIGRSRAGFADAAPPILAVLAVLVVWEVGVRAMEVAPFILPPPTAIFAEFQLQFSRILINMVATSVAVFVGFVVAAAVAIPLAFLLVYFPVFAKVVYPILVATQVIPKVAIIPVLIVWFGFGTLPKLIVALLLAFFPIIIDTTIGLRSVHPDLIHLVKSMGGSRQDVFRRLRIPTALPYIFSGLKVGVTLAVVGAVIGEFVGASRGLGFMIIQASGVLNTSLVFAGLLGLSFIGIVGFYVVVAIERVVIPWHVTQRVEMGFTP